jgi:serine/threonine protein kinase
MRETAPSKQIDINYKLKIIQQLCDVLQYLHEIEEITFGDLATDNVMVSGDCDRHNTTFANTLSRSQIQDN